MEVSAVALAWVMEFQKVMSTGPLDLVNAESGQLGSLVAAAADAAERPPAADTAVMLDASMRDPAMDLKSGIGFMTVCLPPGPAVRDAGWITSPRPR
jgi:hypothetical protein